MTVDCIKVYVPAPQALQVDLVLEAVPEPNFDAKPGEKRLTWTIWVGSPLDYDAEFWPLVSLDGVWYDPVGPNGIPAHFAFRAMISSGFRNIYAGETHTVCMKPKYPDKPGANWSTVCKTIIII